MSATTFAIVMASALTHATWNLYAKRATIRGATFVWLVCALTSMLYFPPAAYVYARAPHATIGIREAGLIVATSVLHLGYFLCLQGGYRAGDLSFVYPIARATGPLLAGTAAVVALHERLGVTGALGIGSIVAGALLISLRRGSFAEYAPALRYGLAAGAFIAAYTICDKVAVATLRIEPIVYEELRNIAQTLLFAPLAFARRADLIAALRTDRVPIGVVSLLSPLAYILVLFALVGAPVSVVAPIREVGIVFGALLGAHVLRERDPRRRIAGAVLIFAGIVVLVRS